MELPAALEPGRMIAGKYRIERILGSGGMGVVVAATHLVLKQQVALKFLRADRQGRPRDVDRFVREARSVARITSPHVPRILDAGTVKAGRTLTPFIALEYLEGVDLARVLRRHGRLSEGLAAAIVSQACEALTEAHKLGIVHRDVKPANLFLLASPAGLSVKVLDFGVALWCADTDAALTTTDGTVGSPAYMAPEQMRLSRAADARSDLWSLGVILHEALSGALPFPSLAYAELVLKVLLDEPPRLSPDQASAGLSAVVARCLAKEPDGRPASAAELRAALAPFVVEPDPAELAELLDAASDTPGDESHPLAVGSNTADELAAIASRPVPRRRRTRLALALAAVAALGAGAVALRADDVAPVSVPMPVPAPVPVAVPVAPDAGAIAPVAAPAPPPSPPQPAHRKPRRLPHAPRETWDPLAAPY